VKWPREDRWTYLDERAERYHIPSANADVEAADVFETGPKILSGLEKDPVEPPKLTEIIDIHVSEHIADVEVGIVAEECVIMLAIWRDHSDGQRETGGLLGDAGALSNDF
jgi:hypothetical protein